MEMGELLSSADVLEEDLSISRQEHVLYIIFSSEYKSSCVLRPSQRLVTLS